MVKMLFNYYNSCNDKCVISCHIYQKIIKKTLYLIWALFISLSEYYYNWAKISAIDYIYLCWLCEGKSLKVWLKFKTKATLKIVIFMFLHILCIFNKPDHTHVYCITIMLISLWNRLPVIPGGHWQLNELSSSVQEPSFWQGWLRHSFTSISQLCP